MRILHTNTRWIHGLLLTAGLIAAPALSTSLLSNLEPQFGVLLSDIDSNVAPGDDFFSFANGGWMSRTSIPASRSAIGTFPNLADKADATVGAVIDHEVLSPASRIGAFYRSFMDEGAIQAKGLGPIRPWTDSIYAAGSKDALAGIAGRLQRIGAGSVTEIEIGADPETPDRTVARLQQAGTGLSERSYYLDQGREAEKIRGAYLSYVTTMLQRLGAKDADARAEAVLAFETTVAKAQWTPGEQRDERKSFNRFSTPELEKRAPGFRWDAYLTALGLGEQKSFVVNEPSAAEGFASAWAAVPLPVLKDWLAIELLRTYARYLPQDMVDARFAMFGTALFGTTAQASRSRRAITLVRDGLRDDVGRAYARAVLPPAAKAKAEALVRDLVHAYQGRIGRANWLSAETQRRAIAKIGRAEVLIGYPERWRDYAGLRIAPDDLVGNVARATEWEFAYQLRRLEQPADRREWELTPMDAGGWAKPGLVLIGIPAALLQPPIYDPQGDPATNYGGLGQIIGHELSHLLDDQGRRYDEFGRLAEWWRPEEVSHFETRATVLSDQYSSYEPAPGLHIDGARTLGENLADLSGLQIAYDAYRLHAAGRSQLVNEFTGDQRFFLGFAKVLQGKQRPEAERRQLLGDVHAPPQWRANEVRNVDAWYNAFAVRAGQRLYLAPTARAGVW